MEKFKGNGDTGQGAPNKDFGGSEKVSKMKCLTEGSRWKRWSEEQGAGPKTGGHCSGLKTRERMVFPRNTRETACQPCDPISPLQKHTMSPENFCQASHRPDAIFESLKEKVPKSCSARTQFPSTVVFQRHHQWLRR